MKSFYLIPLSIAMILAACGDSASDNSSPYGDLQYERHATGLAVGDCYVYATDNQVTIVFEQNYGDLGGITSTGKTVIGDPVKSTDEVVATSIFFKDAIAEQCELFEIAYAMLGGTVTCTDTEVKARAEAGHVSADSMAQARETAIETSKDNCDYYLEQISEVKGSSEKAESCTVKESGDTLVMDIAYPNKSAKIEAIEKENGISVVETYKGIDDKTLTQLCDSYKADGDNSDVVCEGSVFTYQTTKLDNGIAGDKASMNFACKMLLEGYMTLEEAMLDEE